jgi:hypothetical protein
MKKKLCLPKSIYEIPQGISINIFDKYLINQMFNNSDIQNFNQLNPSDL